jgi:glycosyltransferase involved in cell wall biosynthesis
MQPHKDVPPYLWHADLLLLPPSQHHPSAAWTSPLKLGEYLASGTPVIATQIPALQDWLTPEDVAFVPPDDAAALAQAITDLLNDPPKQQALSQNTRQKARTLSYTHRAETILSLLTRENQAK